MEHKDLTPADLRPGDIVRHSTKFMRSIGMYAGAPLNGRVEGPGELRGTVSVLWCDRSEAQLIQAANLVRWGEPDRSVLP